MADDRGGREAVENAAPGQGGRKTSMTVGEALGHGLVDPGFAQAVRRHVDEDGPLVVAVAKIGDPALWDNLTQSEGVKAMMRAGTLAAARERSMAQARALLRAGLGAVA